LDFLLLWRQRFAAGVEAELMQKLANVEAELEKMGDGS